MKNAKPKIVLATNGSQGVMAIRELYALGFKNSDLIIITYDSPFNGPLIQFLEFNKKDYVLVKNSLELEELFDNLDFDFLISISFRYIFSDTVLNKAKMASINFHPGILPDYRGSFSIPWAIINDEKYVGYTFHYMVGKVDAGKCIFQEKFEIQERNAHQLNYLVFQHGIRQIGNVIELALRNESSCSVEGDGKFYRNRLPHDGEIDSSWDGLYVARFIRAMYFPPFESAYLEKNGVRHYFNEYSEYLELMKQDS